MLIVEDGTGLSTADSYVSLLELETHLANFGLMWSGADKEVSLRRATRALEYLYPLIGSHLTSAQALHYPIKGFVGVPVQLKNAVIELAVLMGNDFDPFAPLDEDTIGLTELTVKVGDISETRKWADGSNRASQITHLRPIDILMSGLYYTSTNMDWYQLDVYRG